MTIQTFWLLQALLDAAVLALMALSAYCDLFRGRHVPDRYAAGIALAGCVHFILLLLAGKERVAAFLTAGYVGSYAVVAAAVLLAYLLTTALIDRARKKKGSYDGKLPIGGADFKNNVALSFYMGMWQFLLCMLIAVLTGCAHDAAHRIIKKKPFLHPAFLAFVFAGFIFAKFIEWHYVFLPLLK